MSTLTVPHLVDEVCLLVAASLAEEPAQVEAGVHQALQLMVTVRGGGG